MVSHFTYIEMVTTKEKLSAKISVNQTKQQLFVTANVTGADLTTIFRYLNEAYCSFFVCECI